MGRILDVLTDAAAGRFPVPDGGVTVIPTEHGVGAVLSFTGHAVIATDLPPESLEPLHLDGFGAALSPRALLALAGGGQIGVIDVTLVAAGLGGGRLPRTDAWDDHPRVRFARATREQVVVHGDADGFVTLGLGLGRRPEMSVEVAPGAPAGLGRRLIGEALHLAPQGRTLFAAVSPGNARSLRGFLAAGFVPLGSEVHLRPADGSPLSEHHPTGL